MKYPSGPRRRDDPDYLNKWGETSDAAYAAWVHDYDGPHTDVDKLIEELEKRGWRFQPEEEQKK